MKKLLPLIILVCSLSTFGQMSGRIKIAKATLRSSPSEKAPVVATISRGSRIIILPRKSVGVWSRVSYGKKTGWILTAAYAADQREVIEINNPPRRAVNELRAEPNIGKSSGEPQADSDEPIPPPVSKNPQTPPKTISGGIVNGKAISLPRPPYPPAARAVNASGQVQVQVLIDEDGSVVAASAISGHPLLRQASVDAARSAKFSPTILSGQPVKVSGIILYNFAP